jgi:hypothetical protein
MPTVKTDALRAGDVAARKAALAGIVFAVLFLAGFRILAVVPGANASDQEIVDFYGGNQREVIIVAAFYVVPFAGIAFLWFLASLRYRVQHISGAEDILLSTVQLLSGVLFVAMMFAAAAGRAATAAAIEYADAAIPRADETRDLLALSESFSGVFAVRTAAVFVAAGTTQARRAQLFPRWLTVVSYLVSALLLFTTTFFWPLVTVFPLWVAAVSILILRRTPPATEVDSTP